MTDRKNSFMHTNAENNTALITRNISSYPRSRSIGSYANTVAAQGKVKSALYVSHPRVSLGFYLIKIMAE